MTFVVSQFAISMLLKRLFLLKMMPVDACLEYILMLVTFIYKTIFLLFWSYVAFLSNWAEVIKDLLVCICKLSSFRIL